MTVREIIEKYLRDNGFDGLAGDDCGCALEDGIAPCESCDIENCVPGRKVPCPGPDECEYANYLHPSSGCPWHMAAAEPAPPADEEAKDRIQIVFDGPPSHESGRFVEVEQGGKSINFGEWKHRADGFWVLELPARRLTEKSVTREDFDEWAYELRGWMDTDGIKTILMNRLRSIGISVVAKDGGGKDFPKVVCFCGSVRFSTEMLIVAWEYAKAGHIVLSWCVLPDSYFAAHPESRGDDSTGVHAAEKEGVREILDEIHKRKIDLADEVLVINIGGYVGDSTKSEIRYAIDHGKPVRWLEPDSADAILAALPDDKPQ